MTPPKRGWLVPLKLRVEATSASDARAKAIGALCTGAPVPSRWLTVGNPEKV